MRQCFRDMKAVGARARRRPTSATNSNAAGQEQGVPLPPASAPLASLRSEASAEREGEARCALCPAQDAARRLPLPPASGRPGKNGGSGPAAACQASRCAISVHWRAGPCLGLQLRTQTLEFRTLPGKPAPTPSLRIQRSAGSTMRAAKTGTTAAKRAYTNPAGRRAKSPCPALP